MIDYSALNDEHLTELVFVEEDRLPLAAAEELARREGAAPLLAQVVMDKQSWLTELPEWWAVVHATYILGLRGDDQVVMPLLAALRWSDAFDCDWVTELLPSILGQVGPPCIPGLTHVARDLSAGWSARDLALKGLAAISLASPASASHVFRIVGERFMDEQEDRLVRQLAGQILLDFRCQQYRIGLIKFARQQWLMGEMEQWYPGGFHPEEVDAAFRDQEPEVWHYQEDWMRFYAPAEIQRRQKRWTRERLGPGRVIREVKSVPPGGGHVLPLSRLGKKPESPPAPESGDPEKGPGQE